MHNPHQIDTDHDGIGDVCDSDIDGDGVPNGTDNCPATPNADPKKYDDLGNLVVKDHIVDCTAQLAIYDEIQDAIEFLEDMLATP